MKAALVVAHPGHELVVHGWMEEVRPTVFAITDGSGRGGVPRLDSSIRVVEAAGAKVGSLFGIVSDQQVYRAVLEHDHEFFVRLADALSAALVEENVDYVAGDAAEGLNPVHDLCRMVLDGAVRRASSQCGPIVNYEFPLFRSHEVAGEENGSAIYRLLGAEALQRKLAAATGYSELSGEVAAAFSGTSREVLDRYPELAKRVDQSLSTLSREAYAFERMTPVSIQPENETPFYEAYSEQLVASGVYAAPIRYHEHIRPIRRRLERYPAQVHPWNAG
ncbi:MAG: hypothetical protein ABI718_08195 [Acidobacteriota bacterium]